MHQLPHHPPYNLGGVASCSWALGLVGAVVPEPRALAFALFRLVRGKGPVGSRMGWITAGGAGESTTLSPVQKSFAFPLQDSTVVSPKTFGSRRVAHFPRRF
jgi:hypothetical protein